MGETCVEFVQFNLCAKSSVLAPDYHRITAVRSKFGPRRLDEMHFSSSYSISFRTILKHTSTASSSMLAPRRRGCFLRNLRSEEHTSELQSRFDLVCRLLLEKKKQ